MSAEEHLLQLAENVPQVVWITDPELRTLWYISPAYEKVWGRTCASLYASRSSWLDAVHDQDRERVRQGVEDVRRTGKFEVDYRVVRPDGSIRWVSDRGTLVRGPSGDPVRFVGLAEDITERVRSEEQLRQARDLAEAADHAKSAFLAAMSHELRTPLTAIIGFSELLEDGTGGPLTDKQVRYVENILSSGRTLLDLIDQVLDIARVEVGRLSLTLTPVSLGELLEDVAMLVRPLAAKKETTLQVAQEDDLPKITADAPKVKQVIFGLLVNAVRHVPEGGQVRAHARRSAEGSGGEAWIEVCVQDNGPGIPLEYRDRLLNDFSPIAGNDAAARPGTGVSLALARKLIELHGGRMWLDGEERGTAVRFVLPQTARPTGLRTSPSEPMRAVPAGDRPLVLVVEDDRQASDLLGHYLEEAGYGVACAFTRAQALSMASQLSPFAITLDPALPDGDGLELIRDLRQLPAIAEVPIIVVSVSAPRADLDQLGAIAWIVKPVNRGELLGVLRRQRGGLVPGHRTRQET